MASPLGQKAYVVGRELRVRQCALSAFVGLGEAAAPDCLAQLNLNRCGHPTRSRRLRPPPQTRVAASTTSPTWFPQLTDDRASDQVGSRRTRRRHYVATRLSVPCPRGAEISGEVG